LQVVSPCADDAVAGHTEELDHCVFHGSRFDFLPGTDSYPVFSVMM
jgi:hypothetical protein